MAIHHPASIEVARDIVASFIAKLEVEFPPDVVAAAQERGQARDLEATAAELLAELEE